MLDLLLAHIPRLVVRVSRDILVNFVRLLTRTGGPTGAAKSAGATRGKVLSYLDRFIKGMLCASGPELALCVCGK
jgi:hypothetical protein